jgi:hypothetical protein
MVDIAKLRDHCLNPITKKVSIRREYVLDFELKIVVGTPTICSGWIIRYREDFPCLTTCYVKQKR